MLTRKGKLFVLLNFLGIAVNVMISLFYYLSLDGKAEAMPEIIIENVFLLIGSILFALFWRRVKKYVLYFMFVLVCCGLIFCVVESVIKKSPAERFTGLIGCVYFFVNLLHGVLVCK